MQPISEMLEDSVSDVRRVRVEIGVATAGRYTKRLQHRLQWVTKLRGWIESKQAEADVYLPSSVFPAYGHPCRC